jgi:hypothetical protein
LQAIGFERGVAEPTLELRHLRPRHIDSSELGGADCAAGTVDVICAARRALQEQRAGVEYQRAAEGLELEKILVLSKETSGEELQLQRQTTRRSLPAEPAEGAAGVAKVCFHHQELRIHRRFDADDTVSTIRAFVACNEQMQPDSYRIRMYELTDITKFPAVPLQPADNGKTLQAMGLWPSAQLCIQERHLQ